MGYRPWRQRWRTDKLGAMRWVVGDIHGCARELDRLLAEIRFDPPDDELWSVGDIVNKGPDSLAAARLWRDVGGHGVLGNHDIHVLLAHSGRKPRPLESMEAFFEADDGEALLALLRDLPVLSFLPGDRYVRPAWIVHAGLHPAWEDLEAQAERLNAGEHDDDWLQSDDVAFATRVRCCDQEGNYQDGTQRDGRCAEGFQPWGDLYRGETLVLHGHWAQRGYYRLPHTIGLDAGCVYGGHLTAWCQEEDRVVHIPARSR